MTAVDFRALVESTADMVAVFDREHRYVYINPAFERAVGLTNAQLVGKRPGETLRPGAIDMWGEAISDVLATGRPRIVEQSFAGHRFAMHLARVGEHVCAFSRDVTEAHRLRHAAYLARAGELLQQFDPETSLRAIVELAVPELADRAFIHLKTAGAPITAAVAHRDPAMHAASRNEIGQPRPIPDGTPIARVLAGGPAELVQVDEAGLARAAQDRSELEYLRAQRYQSVVVAPMTGRDGVLGTISFTTAESGRRYEQVDLEMLAELARRTGIAFDNARLFAAEQQTRRRAEEARDRTRALQALTAKLSGALDEHEVTSTMVDVGRAALTARAGFAWLLEGADALRLSAFQTDGGPVRVDEHRTIPLSAHLPVCDAVKTSRPMMFESLAAMQAGYPGVEPTTAYRAWAVIPFVVAGTAVGAVTFSFGTERTFTEEDRELLAAMMGQASLALQRCKLLAAEREARQQAEASRLRERTLHGLAAKLSSAQTVAQAAAIVCEEVVAALGVHFAAAALRDGNRIKIVGTSPVHHPAEVARVSDIPLTTGLPMAEAIRREELVWCGNDADLARRYAPFQDLWRPTGIRAWGAVPFTFEGRTIGSVAIGALEPRELTDDERDLLRAIAQLAAQAIERARLYEALRASEEQLRIALSAARAGTWRVDMRTMEGTRDATYLALLGEGADAKVIGNFGTCHPDDAAIARASYERAITDDVPYDPEIRVRRVDGSYIWTRTYGRVLRDRSGNPVLMTGITFDIDEARRASEVNETLYRLGVSFAKELDHDRLVRRITEEVVTLVGADGAMFWYQLGTGAQTFAVGAPLDISVPLVRAVRRFAAGGRGYLAVPVGGGTGEPFGTLVLGHREPTYFTEPHERLVAGIANHAAVALENARLYRAVREREQALVVAVERAQVADRRKDEFLAMLGHELRNPLAPITTALDLLDIKGSDVAHRERDVIRRQITHMSRLVDDLLDVSRITRGRLELAKEVVELSTVVARAIEMASPLIEKKQQTLVVSVPREGLLVDADPVRLGQVFQNLMINASKYSGHETTIHVTARDTGESVEIAIADEGTGIAPDLLPQLFEMFVQGKRTIERAEGGLGIGLTIAKSLCELHGGAIAATSDGPGKGSTFTVTLPRAARPAQPRTERRTEPMPKLMKGMRVLVVDDNVDAARVLHEFLVELGHEPAVAHDAPSALELAATFRPDIAVLDIGLPVMDGYDLARELRERLGPEALRLIAMSSYGDVADHNRVTEAGFDHHFVKPIALDVLLTLLGK